MKTSLMSQCNNSCKTGKMAKNHRLVHKTVAQTHVDQKEEPACSKFQTSHILVIFQLKSRDGKQKRTLQQLKLKNDANDKVFNNELDKVKC